MRLCGLLGALVLLLMAGPALAIEDIEVSEDSGFLHERSQVSFPPSLGGMDRRWVRDFGTGQYDVAALYESDDQATFLTFYVYRAGLPNASIWFDRLVAVMAAREGYLPASDASLEPALFSPAGSDTPTGLALAYDLAPGQPHASTGAILFSHGPWLIKLRATSSSMNAVELARLLNEVERSLTLPEPEYLAARAYRVQPCAARLESGAAAVIEPTQSVVAAISLMMDGVGSSVNEDGEKVRLSGPHWCRDDAVEDLSVYRPDDSSSQYVVAFGDSGNALQVGIVMGDLPVVTPKGQGVPIIYAEAPRTMLMALVDRVPDPAAALEIANQARALGTSDRDGHIRVAGGSPAE